LDRNLAVPFPVLLPLAFLLLWDNGVDGLIHISSLTDDYYDFEEDKYALVGFHLHKTYRLGDEIKVEVLQVNIPEHQVDLVLAGENPEMKQYIKAQLQEKNSVLGSKSKNHGLISAP